MSSNLGDHKRQWEAATKSSYIDGEESSENDNIEEERSTKWWKTS